MTNRQIINKLLRLIEYVEKDTFRDDNSRIAVIDGTEYRISDFKNFKRVLTWVNDIYGKNVGSSAEYIENNKEYHRTLALMRYYKRKKNKQPKDFAKMEELNRKLDKIKEKRELKKEKKKLEDELEYKRSINENVIRQELEKEMEIKL